MNHRRLWLKCGLITIFLGASCVAYANDTVKSCVWRAMAAAPTVWEIGKIPASFVWDHLSAPFKELFSKQGPIRYALDLKQYEAAQKAVRELVDAKDWRGLQAWRPKTHSELIGLVDLVEADARGGKSIIRSTIESGSYSRRRELVSIFNKPKLQNGKLTDAEARQLGQDLRDFSEADPRSPMNILFRGAKVSRDRIRQEFDPSWSGEEFARRMRLAGFVEGDAQEREFASLWEMNRERLIRNAVMNAIPAAAFQNPVPIALPHGLRFFPTAPPSDEAVRLLAQRKFSEALPLLQQQYGRRANLEITEELLARNYDVAVWAFIGTLLYKYQASVGEQRVQDGEQKFEEDTGLFRGVQSGQERLDELREMHKDDPEYLKMLEELYQKFKANRESAGAVPEP
ncbi:MAG: hypothetical protein AB7P04_07600 [Bacteriovoracia bacterium]